ncbi:MULTISPECIES: histidine phosphatase family protein [unclassified Rhizobacter]|uniref:histidine phosphatase family protein n=1 Tax=unclassified Rhizobacter TaxID=2640088 RepID=UPI000AF60469|nr:MULTISPECIES: histidine phosphatase family protein [unclassified Rhizobacter]
MTSIFLIRHAAYDEGQVDGVGPRVDLGLSDKGKLQAQALADRLRVSQEIKADVLYASTLPRARQTAALLAPALGLSATLEEDLAEWRSGDGDMDEAEFIATWQGLGDRDRLFHRFVDGCETAIEFSARVQSALHAIVKKHVGQTAVLVVHGGVMQVAFQYFFGYGDAAFRRAYPAAGYTSITHWNLPMNTSKWVLESSNDTHHLKGA